MEILHLAAPCRNVPVTFTLELMRIIALLLAVASFGAGAAPTLCQSSEVVAFSCEVGRSHKIVSLCASADLSAERGSLTYRFGLPGHIELEFPRAGTQSSAKQFRQAHYFRYQTDRTEVTFKLGEYSYAVFSYFEADLKPDTMQGVRVTRGKKESTLSCSSQATANFSSVEAAVPCDSENALQTCR